MAFTFKRLFNQALITSIDNQLRFALSIPSQSGAYNITWENLKALLGNLYNDVLSYDNLTAFPITGNTNFIYIAKDTNLIYRWGGVAYVQIGGGDLSNYVTNEELTTILSDYALTSQIPDISGLVPYTGASQNVDLGSHDILSAGIQFDTSTISASTNVGTTRWNDTDKTIETILDSNVILQHGQENHLRAVNKSGADIDDGKVVYIDTAQGNRPTIKLARANALTTSFIIGITTEPITNNQEGFVTVFGIVRGFNTSGFAAGDKLYLSATIAGELTNIAPSGQTYYSTHVAESLNSTNNGSIFVDPQNPLSNYCEISNLVAPTAKAVRDYVSSPETSISLGNDNLTLGKYLHFYNLLTGANLTDGALIHTDISDITQDFIINQLENADIIFKRFGIDVLKLTTGGLTNVLNALQVGTNTAGNNASILATLGSELAPALTSGNYTLGTGWGYVTSPNRIEKLIDGNGTVTPTASTTIVAGTTYKVVIDVTVTASSFSWTLGAVSGVNISATGVYTEYITASTTAKLIITPVATGLRCVINSISFKALTDSTGDLTVEGDLFTNIIKSSSGSPAIYIGKDGNISLFAPRPSNINSGYKFISTVGFYVIGTITSSNAITAPTSQCSTYYPNGDTDLTMSTSASGAITTKAIIFKVGKGGISRLEVLRISDAGNLEHTSGLYFYRAASPTSDTIGDTRTSNQSGIYTIEYCTVANATKGAGTWASYFKISSAGIPQFPMFTPAAEAVVTSSTTGVLSVANLLQNTLVGKGTLNSGNCTIYDTNITTSSLALVTVSTVGVSTSVPIKYTASNGSMLFSTGQSSDTCDFTYQIFV